MLSFLNSLSLFKRKTPARIPVEIPTPLAFPKIDVPSEMNIEQLIQNIQSMGDRKNVV